MLRLSATIHTIPPTQRSYIFMACKRTSSPLLYVLRFYLQNAYDLPFKEIKSFTVSSPEHATRYIHTTKIKDNETKLRIHNITAKAALKFGSEVWVLKKREEQRLEAAKMKFLRHLLGITKLDKEKNQCIRGKKNRSTEYSKGNKTIPEKVATTRTEDGHK